MGAALLRRRGVPTAEVELGWSVAWSGWEPDAGNGAASHVESRPVEVACLASRGAENDRVLASFAPTLWRRRGCLLGPPRRAGGTGAAPPPPQLPRGEERLQLLRRSQLMLIGIGEESAAVERLRALQGAASGTALVAAHGCDLHPLLPASTSPPPSAATSPSSPTSCCASPSGCARCATRPSRRRAAAHPSGPRPSGCWRLPSES